VRARPVSIDCRRFEGAATRDTTGIKDHFDGFAPTLQTLCDTQIFPAMARAGITPTQKVNYTYVNADGSEIWSHTFTP
jgi:hypothetical protein